MGKTNKCNLREDEALEEVVKDTVCMIKGCTKPCSHPLPPIPTHEILIKYVLLQSWCNGLLLL